MRIVPIGDTALAVTPAPGGGPSTAIAFADALRRTAPTAVTDILPAFDTVTILYDPTALRIDQSPIDTLEAWIESTPLDASTNTDTTGRLIELPVRYGGDGGPDLQELAHAVDLPVTEVIDRHRGGVYTVAAVGFLPGFAYLDGLPKELHVPRRNTPRTRVPAGSVAIGGPYTGVYPVASPGGWHLIGRTSATLFDPKNPDAISVRAGDRVRFVLEGER